MIELEGGSIASKFKAMLSPLIRLIYVAMTRATQELVMTHGEVSVLGEKMGKAMGVLEGM